MFTCLCLVQIAVCNKSYVLFKFDVIFVGTREICYTCDGENDNELCNSRGIEECEIGEVSQT